MFTGYFDALDRCFEDSVASRSQVGRS